MKKNSKWNSMHLKIFKILNLVNQVKLFFKIKYDSWKYLYHIMTYPFTQIYILKLHLKITCKFS